MAPYIWDRHALATYTTSRDAPVTAEANVVTVGKGRAHVDSLALHSVRLETDEI
jgi:hypothetical protein